MFKYILFLHILGATIWTGGHLVLAITIIPKALRNKSVETISQFETNYERIGIPALLIQVVSGLWLAYRFLPDFSAWFLFDSFISRLIVIKLILLFTTIGFAIDARLRVIPKLNEHNLKLLAFHVIPVTIISVLFVFVGVIFRTGGFF